MQWLIAAGIAGAQQCQGEYLGLVNLLDLILTKTWAPSIFDFLVSWLLKYSGTMQSVDRRRRKKIMSLQENLIGPNKDIISFLRYHNILLGRAGHMMSMQSQSRMGKSLLEAQNSRSTNLVGFFFLFCNVSGFFTPF